MEGKQLLDDVRQRNTRNPVRSFQIVKLCVPNKIWNQLDIPLDEILFYFNLCFQFNPKLF